LCVIIDINMHDTNRKNNKNVDITVSAHNAFL
jgi:hypothetical protein